jgi:hypothetical protein
MIIKTQKLISAIIISSLVLTPVIFVAPVKAQNRVIKIIIFIIKGVTQGVLEAEGKKIIEDFNQPKHGVFYDVTIKGKVYRVYCKPEKNKLVCEDLGAVRK